jgi:hypothetical protein
MPRKGYAPRNRYVHNANVSEEDFETLVWLYVQGLAYLSPFFALALKAGAAIPCASSLAPLPFALFSGFL